jgi:hypothetical protein
MLVCTRDTYINVYIFYTLKLKYHVVPTLTQDSESNIWK